MKSIAIVDDNTDQSDTVKTNIEISLTELRYDLNVITTLPFSDPDDYFEFIENNDVCVLILDQMLNDQAIDDKGPVDYKGSDLIGKLRIKLPEFPIFALTVIPSDTDLKEKYSQYEDIISRKEFYDDPNKYVPKFWRASKNYLNENESELSEFNKLTTEISSGNTDPDLIQKLQALQVKLELPFTGFKEKGDWLKEYSNQISSLENINQLIKSKLGNELEEN